MPFMREVYGSSRASEMDLVPWTDAQKREFLDMQFHAQKSHYELHYPDCDFLVIELDGAPIGRLYIDRGDDIRITDIALLPQYQRLGIGKMLLQEILDEAQRSTRCVSLYVEHFNPVRGLYDRLGFKHVDTNGVYHRMLWTPIGAAG